MIVITFALPAESSALPRGLGRSRDGQVEIFHTGVGAKVCRERLRAFLETRSPSLLISSGFAGALRDDVKVGQLFIAENFSDPAEVERARTLLGGETVVGQLVTSPQM